MNNTLARLLTRLLQTNDNAILFASYLRDVTAKEYETKTRTVQHIIGAMPPLFAQCMQEIFSQQKSTVSTFPQFTKLAKELLVLLEEIPTINITIAFRPKDDVLLDISSDIQKYFRFPAFIAYAFDPEIIGGVIIKNTGIYKDYSLRKVLEAKKLTP